MVIWWWYKDINYAAALVTVNRKATANKTVAVVLVTDY